MMGLVATVEMVTRLLQMERNVKVGGDLANSFYFGLRQTESNHLVALTFCLLTAGDSM